MKPKYDSPKPKKGLSWLWVTLAVLLAFVAVGVLWWWKASPAVSGVCSTGDLSLSIGQSQGAAGTEYLHAVLTNTSSRACTLKGYPVVSVLDKNGENHKTGDAQQNNAYAADKVTVSPHGQANVVLGFPGADNFDAGVCTDTSATLRLYLPGGAVTPTSVALTTPLQRKVCPGFSVTALQPGA